MKNEKEVNEAIKSIFDSLTEEQKEKAMACKTMDELTALAGKEGIELPDELLDNIAGGSIYPAENGGWWIISDVAKRVQTIVYGSKEEAQFTAKRMGFSDKVLTDDEYKKIVGCI